MDDKVFALVDCNNFYTSCEKIFRPDLKNKPIIVLSNNDGCVISRSAEAKLLGIKMAAPFYQIKDLVELHNIVLFSSNYCLYGDLSQRVMLTLESLAPKVEVYSIDEAFLDLSHFEFTKLDEYGQHIKNTVMQHTGIGVGVGIAPTKTLAKLANYAAKKYPKTQGVVDLTVTERQQRLMKITPVSEVWGVGYQLTKKLNLLGITTALDLARSDPVMMQRKFSIVLSRTIEELRGVSCLDLEIDSPAKQQIVSSRSFGTKVTELAAMREAVATYAEIAATKLRAEARYTKNVDVFIRSNAFNQDTHYANSAHSKLHTATNDTRIIVRTALNTLDSIWKDGISYVKAGIILSDFYESSAIQPDLFVNINQGNTKLMQTMDLINQKYGRIHLASQGLAKEWQMKRNHLSPKYTTDWASLPLVG